MSGGEKKSAVVAIVGATGNIGTAVCIFLNGRLPSGTEVRLLAPEPDLEIRDRSLLSGDYLVRPLPIDLELSDDGLERAIQGANVVLDCTPGKFSVRIAEAAFACQAHLANITEHVEETRHIIASIPPAAGFGVVLQTGLAPGYINVLGRAALEHFRRLYRVDRVDYLGLRVGALVDDSPPPAYYRTTWSPIGVVTEYVEDSEVLLEGEVLSVPSLGRRETVQLGNYTFEAALTSGGTADLPEKLKTHVRNLDYKTLRFPGHYAWVDAQLAQVQGESNDRKIEWLQERMIDRIDDGAGGTRPVVPFEDRDDFVAIQVVVARGADRFEDGRIIRPASVGGNWLRAIRSTTASALAQMALGLLRGEYRGLVCSHEVDPVSFLHGDIVSSIYGRWNWLESPDAR